MKRTLAILSLIIGVMDAVLAAPVVIGLDADLSSGSARSGVAIQRGAQLAIDEINEQGGVLGRQMRLVVRDHRGNPARGADNILELAEMEGLVSILAGLHTPVAMRELKSIHRHGIPFLVPWAAGTSIVENSYQPNYVFRVSIRDRDAGRFLVEQALAQGFTRVGLLLERTAWGRSNQKSINLALQQAGLSAVETEWFHWGERKFQPVLKKLQRAGAEVVLLVANAPEGEGVVKEMATLSEERRMPILSHWGITGGTFYQSVGHLLRQVELQFLQTYSFLKPHDPVRSADVVERYCSTFGCTENVVAEKAIFAPAGTAHAYDLVHLLKVAIETVGSTERTAVRDGLEQIKEYRGLVRHYHPPFTMNRHDALDMSDMYMARYDEGGSIVPVR